MWVAHQKNRNSRVYYKMLFKQLILNRKMCPNRVVFLKVSHLCNPWRDNPRLPSISFVFLSSSRFSSNNITGICYVYNTRQWYCSTHAVTSEKIACYLLVRVRNVLLWARFLIGFWLDTMIWFKTQYSLIQDRIYIFFFQECMNSFQSPINIWYYCYLLSTMILSS